jgi:hypothetical protein
MKISLNTLRLSTVVFAISTLFGAGCSKTTQTEIVQPAVIEYQVRNVPGVVEYIWEEPMVDVVDVPPGLDPEGHYYRPGHQEVIEIRQGRWEYYKRPKQK